MIIIMDRLKKREIEVMALKPLLRKLETTLSFQDINALLTEINEMEAFERGRNQGTENPADVIEALYEDVSTWGDGGEMEIRLIEKTREKLSFDVRRCPYFELYRALGMEKYGVAFSCCRDEPFAKGFNKNLRLKRTKTLMEGDQICDFRYTLDEKTKP
jgi:hypothetical protein